MRTTISLDDSVFENARRLAAEAGVSLSTLIEAALRDRLTPKTADPAPAAFQLITYGGSGLQPGRTWDRLEAQMDADDDISPGTW